VHKLKIKSKLILLFILIKVIPLLILSYIAIEGANNLNNYFEKTTKNTFEESKNIITKTATTAISDSIEALDKKSQTSIERISYEIANNIAAFLYERDKDLLFLSSIELNTKVLNNFYKIKTSPITVPEKYKYNDNKQKWETVKQTIAKTNSYQSELKDNDNNFNLNNKKDIKYKDLPIYKEIQVIDLNGNEIYKVSSIKKKKINIKNKSQTYCKAESYFKEIQKLKKNEIYVSDVIGAYVKTNVIGSFTKEKAKKMGIEFDPEKHAYAGKENPVGKRFEAIIRFATPIFKNNKKIGYLSFALDHKHIMEFTDTFDPLIQNTRKDISDASSGNYAFMWDYEGKNISHPRDYFIMGYNPDSGKLVPGWISADMNEDFKKSKYKDLNTYLENYPKFNEQSLKRKPNISQLKSLGEVGLDCRYLNFAPQCKGWMKITKDGGYGSFIIFWSNVWKLTTAAAIPYYTGKYSNSKRGFGFVSIGANVDEFHLAANQTKKNVNKILETQIKTMKKELDDNNFSIIDYIHQLIRELSIITAMMVLIIIAIAIWMSNLVTSKISNLLKGTKEYSKHNFNHKIDITSRDEIGELEHSFNNMADEINELIKKQNNSNILLDIKANEANQASKAKSNFLASMSHEIRTPLNAILGFIEILLEKEKDKQNKEYLNIINDSGHNLVNIINDILDFSKIESNKLTLEYVKIDPYNKFANIAKQFNANANIKNITLETHISSSLSKCIQIDILRVTQVINNLLSNALKFTNKNGTIIFSVDCNKKADEIFISVEDDGIGVTKDKQAMIFDAFAQADNSTTRKYGGTGLGLSISSRLVKLMGGDLKLDPIQENGARFYFNIPLKECNSCIIPDNKFSFTLHEPNLTPLYNSHKNNNYILIVEDNKANQLYVKVIMKKLSLKFKIANNGYEAVEMYKKENFEIILMDENMPVMSGTEATKKIREIEKQNNKKYTPIIAVTANALEGDKDRFLSIGMDDYLSKPLKQSSLVKMLSKYIQI